MGKKGKQWQTLLFGAPKSLQMITAITLRHLLLGRKAMTILDSTLKNRDITLLRKACQVKAMIFPPVLYGYESWTIKKAERWRIDAFELWYWGRLLGLQGDSAVHPKGNQSLNIHWKDWCWSWNSNTLATWCKEPTHWERPLCWERLKAGGERDDRGWDGWMASPTWWTWVWVNLGSWWWTGRAGVLHPMGSQRFRHDWVTELNWFFNSLFVYILDCYH